MTDEETGRRCCRRMRASIAAACSSAALLVAAFLSDREVDSLPAVLGIVNLVSASLYSFHVGRIAMLLGRSWVTWGFGSVAFPPVGALIAYFRLRRLAREKSWWPE